MTPLLSVRDVRKRFGQVTAVDGLSFDVSARTITSVIGPNGSGKTSLMNVLTGFYRPHSGTICLGDTALAGLAPHRISQLGIARTFQHIRLFADMSVLDNVLVASERRGWRNAKQRAVGMLERLSLAGLLDARASTLSYGDQRRLEIARCLATRPRLLILDEPAAGMNPTEKRALHDLLHDIRAQEVTVLLVEHDMELIMGISDKVVVLNAGRVLATGTPELVQADPAVIEAYLGAPRAAA
jgi:branched-chain amino acid transport system ATP-binding protein